MTNVIANINSPTPIEVDTDNTKFVANQCHTCEGTGKVVENAGCCGGCDQCGGFEEREVDCPDCSLPEPDTEPVDDR